MNLEEVTLQDLLPMIQRLPEIEREQLRQLLEKESSSQEIIEDKSSSWRQQYLARIQSNSIWSDDIINRIEQAGKELNRWNILK
jgi:hypothetical protein